MNKNIKIKEPCSEDFAKMTPTQQGAFCDKCAMEVYDFTNKSTQEIKNVLALSLGGRVCGRLGSNQMETLNADFELWQMKSKRSMQSALVFSLIVAFGFTLFSCGVETEKAKIDRIQKIGMSVLADSSSESDTLRNAESSSGNQPVGSEFDGKSQIGSELAPTDASSNELIRVHNRVEDVSNRVENTQYPGMIVRTKEFDQYLIAESEPEIIKNQLIETGTLFEAMVYPNPAKNRSTLRIMMPKEQKVSVNVCNLNGQMIRKVSSDVLREGENNIPLDLLNVPSGTYLISIQSAEFNQSVRFIKI
jgi:hypothetical protein